MQNLHITFFVKFPRFFRAIDSLFECFFTMIYKESEDLVALNFENSVTCNLFHGGVVCAKFAHTTFEVFPRLIKSPYKIYSLNIPLCMRFR